MKPQKNGVLQGTLDMLVLRALVAGPMHGFGVARWIESVTGERLSIEEGALYPALHRLARRQLVTSEWGRSENGRKAKYYRLTPVGRHHLEKMIDGWRMNVDAIEAVLSNGG